MRRAGIVDRLPRSPLLRRVLGILFLVGGILGFLPILGFWMIPIGLALLGADSPRMRRLSRRLRVRLGRLYQHAARSLRRRRGRTRKTPADARRAREDRAGVGARQRSQHQSTAGGRRP